MRDKPVILESLESRVLLDADAIPFPVELMDYEPGSSVIVDSFPSPDGVPDDLLQDIESFPHFAVAISVEVLSQQGYLRLVLEDVDVDSDVNLRINGVLSSYAEPQENRDPSARRIGPVPESLDRIEIDILASDLPVGSHFIETDILSPSDSGKQIAVETRSVLLLVQDSDSSLLDHDTQLSITSGALSGLVSVASDQNMNFSTNAEAASSDDVYGAAFSVSMTLSGEVESQVYNTNANEAASGSDTSDGEAASTETKADTGNDGTGIFCIILPRSVAEAGAGGAGGAGVAGGAGGVGVDQQQASSESGLGADFSVDLNVSLQADSSVPAAPASGNSPVMSIQSQESFGETRKPSKATAKDKNAEKSGSDSESGNLPTKDVIVTDTQLTPEDDKIHRVRSQKNSREISLIGASREGSGEESGFISITADVSDSTVRSENKDDFDRRRANVASSGRVGIWTSVVVAVLGAKLWQATKKQKNAGGFLPICDHMDRNCDT